MFLSGSLNSLFISDLLCELVYLPTTAIRKKVSSILFLGYKMN